MDSVFVAFDECQRSFAVHAHWISSLRALYMKDHLAFIEAFVSAVNRVLLIFKREPSVERLVEFISHFATDPAPDWNDEFAVFLIKCVERPSCSAFLHCFLRFSLVVCFFSLSLDICLPG